MNIHPTVCFQPSIQPLKSFSIKSPFPIPCEKKLWFMIPQPSMSDWRINAGFFLPLTAESEVKFKLFSGEPLKTSLAQNHLPMIEAVRILKLLGSQGHASTQAIHLANQRMEKMCYSSFCAKGECKALTIAYLRCISLDGIALEPGDCRQERKTGCKETDKEKTG